MLQLPALFAAYCCTSAYRATELVVTPEEFGAIGDGKPGIEYVMQDKFHVEGRPGREVVTLQDNAATKAVSLEQLTDFPSSRLSRKLSSTSQSSVASTALGQRAAGLLTPSARARTSCLLRACGPLFNCWTRTGLAQADPRQNPRDRAHGGRLRFAHRYRRR